MEVDEEAEAAVAAAAAAALAKEEATSEVQIDLVAVCKGAAVAAE